MMQNWNNCKNILCIRLDNMGDVLMSSPAMRALKESFGAKITLLTSSMGKTIASYVPGIDEVIVYDVPWVKTNIQEPSQQFLKTTELLREKSFDAAVIFTVFSQNPLPAVMLAYLAGIPNRLAYCRENPYELLTHWVPDIEPYTSIRHQVRRDLDLVSNVGACTEDEELKLLPPFNLDEIDIRLKRAGVAIEKPWIIFHPGVSEEKRRYPAASWIKAGRMAVEEFDCQIVITGSTFESQMAEEIKVGIGDRASNVAGKFTVRDFIGVIQRAPLVVSVNTSTVHIAAAVGTPVIVLYALTNPQHTPWKAKGIVLPYSVQRSLQSKNEVLRFVNERYFANNSSEVDPGSIVEAIREILVRGNASPIPDLLMDELSLIVKE
jgi:ADP-heptose:LPS heptosyltransferase